ncbi:MAG TPA: hypothetical protein VE243_07220 [Candidatus Acidoferrum sp.]|nr:hypothetical protein [Candidatus Acidoferrum sp.]
MRAFRPRRNPASKSNFASIAFAFLAILLSGCKRAQLPDATSPAAQLYVSRCGNCHVPYNPHEMTAAMWDTQVTMMESKIQAAGQPALTSDQRAAILEYLKRNAGTE